MTFLQRMVEGTNVAKEGPDTLTVNGVVYSLGMTEMVLLETVGEADEILHTTPGYLWYVYGTTTYEDFFMAGIYDGKVVALCSAGPSFSWEGFHAGSVDVPHDNSHATLYTDKNDSNILHAIVLRDGKTAPHVFGELPEALYGEERVNFHLTNAFRLYHGLSILQWSKQATEAARLHSEDMLAQNYFSHASLDGRDFRTRMNAQGIPFRFSMGENIFTNSNTGTSFIGSGVSAYVWWVNSPLHRENMLSDWTHLGVGFSGSTNIVDDIDFCLIYDYIRR